MLYALQKNSPWSSGQICIFQAKPILTTKMFVKKRERETEKAGELMLKAVAEKVPGDILNQNTIETDFNCFETSLIICTWERLV